MKITKTVRFFRPQKTKRESEWDSREVRPVLGNQQNIVNFSLDGMLNGGQLNGSKQNTVVLNAMNNKQANPDSVKILKSSLLE